MIFASLRDVISLRLFCLSAALPALTAAIANTAECINKLVSGFDLSVASLAISIAEPATVISHHKLLFPSISGRMLVTPCEARGISGRMVGITCEARAVIAIGALPYGPP